MSQIKVYAGDETARKWDVIRSRFTSRTAAFAAMVERYYGELENAGEVAHRGSKADLEENRRVLTE